MLDLKQAEAALRASTSSSVRLREAVEELDAVTARTCELILESRRLIARAQALLRAAEPAAQESPGTPRVA